MAQVVECAPNGVAVTAADGNIILLNAELERMFGHNRDELIGKPIEQLIPERYRAGHLALREAATNESGVRAMGTGCELFGLLDNGVEFPIEIGINVIHTSEGMMLVETVIDISVRRRLERMFQRIVEAAPCAMIMVDAAGRIALVNPQAESMFGYARAELVGNSLEMLLPDRLRAAHAAHRLDFARNPAIRQMGVDRELTARRKDGSEFPVEIGLNPVAADDGSLVLAAITDITRRNAMQLELRQANANLEEFSYAASHDLKSPLRGIADLITWITEDLGDKAGPEVERNLGRVSDRIQRLGRVIDDLLAYAHSGKASDDVELVDLEQLIGGIIEILPRPEGFRIEVQVEAKPFVTPRVPLETVLRNLIGNAIKHHDLAAGHITVRARDRGGYCEITVADDGPGIPAAAQERVFRMFQTLAAGVRDRSGIGLALSKRLVEAHGGKIALESAHGARGTTFRVRWPRMQWSPPRG
ncbi:MAG TPA: PAS domain-containing sensor histidine kinase [Steroidobacteraceae bacterium]|jgi:PAS domain S-box-containing protein|nr:PAS domain-containing sensor histidine kinase [Steroidobacteraceae bacterium]